MKVKIEIKHDDASDRKKIVATNLDNTFQKWEFVNPLNNGKTWVDNVSINTLNVIEHVINTILSDE